MADESEATGASTTQGTLTTLFNPVLPVAISADVDPAGEAAQLNSAQDQSLAGPANATDGLVRLGDNVPASAPSAIVPGAGSFAASVPEATGMKDFAGPAKPESAGALSTTDLTAKEEKDSLNATRFDKSLSATSTQAHEAISKAANTSAASPLEPLSQAHTARLSKPAAADPVSLQLPSNVAAGDTLHADSATPSSPLEPVASSSRFAETLPLARIAGAESDRVPLANPQALQPPSSSVVEAEIPSSVSVRNTTTDFQVTGTTSFPRDREQEKLDPVMAMASSTHTGPGNAETQGSSRGTSPSGASDPQPAAERMQQAESAVRLPGVMATAHVLDRMYRSEMHVGLNSSHFGNIELHASLAQDHVAATITTDHAGLRNALAAEMPGLQQAIAQHRLTLDHLQLDSQGSPEQQHQPNQPQTGRPQSDRPPFVIEAAASPESIEGPSWSPTSGLNIHA